LIVPNKVLYKAQMLEKKKQKIEIKNNSAIVNKFRCKKVKATKI